MLKDCGTSLSMLAPSKTYLSYAIEMGLTYRLELYTSAVEREGLQVRQCLIARKCATL